MEGYSNHPVCVCVCDLEDYKISLSRQAFDGWNRMCKVRITCTKILLRKYGSFNGLVVLRHLELLTSAEILQKLTMLFSLLNSMRVLVPV